ncbi:SprT-like domain-containing protein [Saliphagus sp. LR7]|uniref:SprT family zinc-dependent metalloprotease n=1 Tax=Saliphagus sp. LR7 TaxID=2282654 RepID=UPI000DF7F48C|nr:SprT-like domain-containing protein [Saliphagus sp. LR7]
MSDATPTVEEAIVAQARVHAREVADEIGVDLASVDWAVSARAKRRAGVCRYDHEREVATVVLSRRAYRSYDSGEFEAIVRHELVHAWEFQTHGESGHGPRFRERAAAVDAPRHCEPFSEPRYRLVCSDCGWEGKRHRASNPVKAPDQYRCGDCGGGYRVEHVESGRTWTTAGGYGAARAALGDDW